MTEGPLTAEQVDQLADQLAELLRGSEPWLDKRGLADHLACSVRSIETALAEGMPHAVIFGRPKFQVSEVEPWLEAARLPRARATTIAGYCGHWFR